MKSIWPKSVAGGDWSGTASFMVPGPIPQPVKLLSPSGAQNSTTKLCLAWEVEPRATWYEVCVLKNGKSVFGRWIEATNSLWDIRSGRFAMEIINQGGGNYQWWVRGCSGAGIGKWSSPMSFQMAVQTPGATTLQSPSGDISERNISFQWNAVEGATWYYLFVQQTYGTQTFSTWTTNTTFVLDRIPNSRGLFQYWVRTWNPDGFGPWSSTGYFNTVKDTVWLEQK